MAGDRSVRDLREELAAALSAGEVSGRVRAEVGASWHRSARLGLRPNHFEVPYDSSLDADGGLVRAARPVLDQLEGDLSATPVSVLLTDGRGQVLDRRAPDGPLRARLDRILLAPGFLYAERDVGTNAIGTALEEGESSLIEGSEHFADALTTMTSAASPIVDPRTGRVVGIVDLSSAAEHGSPLMLPLAKRTAREIEQRLLDDSRFAERVLLQQFLRERRTTRGPFVIINERTMITNAAADRFVGPGDRAFLWDGVLSMLAGRQSAGNVIVLSSGASLVMRCRPVLDGGEVVGALVRLVPQQRSATGRDRARPARPTFGWESLTDTERGVVDLVSQGLTNRQVSERLLMSPYTVDSHLRSIFRKLAVDSRVDLTRVALERGVTRPGRN